MKVEKRDETIEEIRRKNSSWFLLKYDNKFCLIRGSSVACSKSLYCFNGMK